MQIPLYLMLKLSFKMHINKEMNNKTTSKGRKHHTYSIGLEDNCNAFKEIDSRCQLMKYYYYY